MADSVGEFSGLVELHMPAVHRYLTAVVSDRDLAETLTQECFLKAYRKRESFRGESSIRTWLMRIAINVAKDHWRNRRVRFWREIEANAVDAGQASDSLASAERSPEAQVLAREQADRLFRIVQTLSMRERSVFLLRYVEELQLSEIGHATGLKVGAVKVYLARALTKVREALGTSEKQRKQT